MRGAASTIWNSFGFIVSSKDTEDQTCPVVRPAAASPPSPPSVTLYIPIYFTDFLIAATYLYVITPQQEILHRAAAGPRFTNRSHQGHSTLTSISPISQMPRPTSASKRRLRRSRSSVFNAEVIPCASIPNLISDKLSHILAIRFV